MLTDTETEELDRPYDKSEDEEEEQDAYSQGRGKKMRRGRRKDKIECLSEKMAEEIRKKAVIRAKRSDDPANPIRVRVFREHRERVKTAKAVVDSSSPYAGKIMYASPNYAVRLTNFARIERENTIMLQHLASIIHGKGMVDNRLNPQNVKTCSNRGQDRQIRLLHITFDNLNLLKRIQSQRPVYSRKEQLATYKFQEEIMSKMSLYPLFWQLSKECKWGPMEMKAKQKAQSNPFPRCKLTLGNSKETFGTVVVELNAQVCPMTAENFRGLCTGEYGLSYKCSTIHRVLQHILWQGGDVTGEGGNGNKSIYGETFPDENFKLKHDKPGVISMANCGPNTNGAQFIITAKKLAVLDGANVAFGKVVSGMGVLKSLYSKVSSSGKPKTKIYIMDCGEMDPSEEQEDDLDDEEGEPESQASGGQEKAASEESFTDESGVTTEGTAN